MAFVTIDRGHEGEAVEHCDAVVPHFDEDGMPATTHITDFCTFHRMIAGDVTVQENEGLWYEQLLQLLYLFPIWKDLSRCVNTLTGDVPDATGGGTIGG
jgi:hypothetical protein